MRLARLSTCAAVFGLAALTSAPAGGTDTLPHPTVRLPAPVTLQTTAASYEIQRDGRVVRVAPRVLPFPKGAAWFPGTGVWYAINHGHLVVGRWGRTLWRSRRRYPSRFELGVVTIGMHTVAFSYRSGGSEQLYMARLGNHLERLIARGEFPLGWTPGGVFTYRYAGRALLFRTPTGAREATLGRAIANYDYDLQTEGLYFIAGARLMAVRGGPTQQPIAALAALGVGARPALNPTGTDLVELLGANRLVLLRPAGSGFGHMRLRLDRENISSSIAAAPGGGPVAFTVLSGQPTKGIETVYLLRAGAHTATALHRERLTSRNPCERGAAVEWHGRWLLYSTSEGAIVVLDSTGKRRAIDLSSIARRLTGAEGGVSAYWAGQPPAL
jgi:hypothetical protein